MNVSFYYATLPQCLTAGQPHCAELLPYGLTVTALCDSLMDYAAVANTVRCLWHPFSRYSLVITLWHITNWNNEPVSQPLLQLGVTLWQSCEQWLSGEGRSGISGKPPVVDMLFVPCPTPPKLWTSCVCPSPGCCRIYCSQLTPDKCPALLDPSHPQPWPVTGVSI